MRGPPAAIDMVWLEPPCHRGRAPLSALTAAHAEADVGVRNAAN
jgi:hypothetical protein